VGLDGALRESEDALDVFLLAAIEQRKVHLVSVGCDHFRSVVRIRECGHFQLAESLRISWFRLEVFPPGPVSNRGENF
jgi:hypothetical protein